MHRTHQLFAPLFLALVLSMSGCTQPAHQATPGVFTGPDEANLEPSPTAHISLPEPPGEVSGTYQLYFDQEFIMDVPFKGWGDSQFLQKDGSTRTTKALIFSWQVPGHHP